MAVHKLEDGTFVISACDTWLPGCYESDRAAKFAFKISDKDKSDLRDKALEKNNGVITWQNIKDLRDKAKAIQQKAQ